MLPSLARDLKLACGGHVAPAEYAGSAPRKSPDEPQLREILEGLRLQFSLFEP